MSLRRLAPLLALAPFTAFAQDTVGISPGQVITKSVRVVAGERIVLPPGEPSTCLTIKGDNITVDFAGAYIRGNKDVYHNRENFDGVGLLIDGCKNVVIKNANIQAFRFNLKVINSQNVRLENCNLSFSRAIRMFKDGAVLDTFMNLRDNTAWRTYGAGVWLEKSSNCALENCIATGGLIGTALVDTTGSTLHNCDFSFNGGWGVALSHSSDNVVAWNHLDFVNRSWGGDWGGDSAAVAVADSSEHNFFVGNSMTHSGDGFFLSNRNDVGPITSAGFFSPEGGSGHNVVAYNDASWSPNNAFEGTFSNANVYFDNTASFSGFGYWLGFSTNSLLMENTINDNDRGGIAIEQGKGTKIEGNHMERNAASAIHLWASSAKERSPFPSTEIDILNNLIADSPIAFDLTGSTDVASKENKLVRASSTGFGFADRGVTSPLTVFQQTADWTKLQTILALKPQGFKMYGEQDLPKGTQWLEVADYTPKDYRGDLAAQRQVDPAKIELYLLEKGVKILAPEWVDFEDTPDDPFITRIVAKPTDGQVGEDKPVQVSLVSKDGQRKQTISGILRTATWNLKWFTWRDIGYDDDAGWQKLWASPPVKSEEVRQLGGDWGYKSPTSGIPAEHFALLAAMSIKVPPGRYVFHTVSDDGIRLFVDDRPLIVRWNHHGATNDSAPINLDESVHSFRVEYCQEDGGAVLHLDWTRQP